jgi:NAD(P)-binding Rossmann-like domain
MSTIQAKQTDKAPIEDLDVIVVGAGFAGLYLLDRLRRMGMAVQVFEAGSGLGGVWYWNCYPGARVDSPGPIYQYSRDDLWRNWQFSELYPSWQELREYFRGLARSGRDTGAVVFPAIAGTECAAAADWDRSSSARCAETRPTLAGRKPADAGYPCDLCRMRQGAPEGQTALLLRPVQDRVSWAGTSDLPRDRGHAALVARSALGPRAALGGIAITRAASRECTASRGRPMVETC